MNEKYKTVDEYIEDAQKDYGVGVSDNSGLLSVGEQSCLVFAARYAHSRNTGAADMVVNTILVNWDRLIPETKEQLQCEANEATCNKYVWKKLIDR